MSTPVLPTSPIAPGNPPVVVQGSVVAATNPVGSGIAAVAPSHPGFIRNSPSGELVAASAGGYVTVKVNGVPLPQEPTLDLTGAGVSGADVGGATVATFTTSPAAGITTFNTSPTVYEAGASSVNQAFTASYAVAPTTATLTDTEGHTDDVSLSPTSFVSPHTVTKTAYGASDTFTLSITSPAGPATRSTGIVWAQKVFWGAAIDPGVYNSAFINSLASSVLQLGPSGTFGVNAGAGQSVFYATRTAFGVDVLNFRVNGLPFAISKVASAVNYTNAQGVTEQYDVWKSDNVALGAFSFTES